MFHRVSKTALIFGVAGLLGGCRSSGINGMTDPLTPTSIVIGDPNPTRALAMAPNDRTQIRVVAHNASGQTVAVATPFRFLSRDTSVAVVTDAGVIFSRRDGATQIVVQLDVGPKTLSDSIRVSVLSPQ